MTPDVGATPIRSLTAAQVCRTCDPALLGFADTSELREPAEPFGQQRAMDAVRGALRTGGIGSNVFVLGRPGSGRHAAVRRLLERHAATRPAPPDLCYVYNFDEPQRPRVLSLPPGEGTRLHKAMQEFVEEVGKAIEAAFEGEEYRARLEAIRKEYKQREEEALQALGESALAQGVILVQSPQGFSFAPVRKKQPMSAEEFQALPDAERERIGNTIRVLGEQLMAWMQQLPRMRREMQARIREASRETLALAVGHLIEELRTAFAEHAPVQDFLAEVLKDIVEAGDRFRTRTVQSEDEEISELSGSLSLARYQVNLLVGHSPGGHAPVVSCDNPTYPNLVGRVDHLSHMGTLLTNFTLIKPGALHRANGGYLLLDALQVLQHASSWEGLKRALRSRELRTESLAESVGLGGAASLDPEPVALSLKVVLFGERQHYYLLQEADADFDELFRVAADFEDDVPRDADNTAGFAQLVGSLARGQGLRPCDAPAVARLLEQAARDSGHAGRLSTQTRLLEQLLHEADAHAAREGRAVIGRADVRHALAQREQRCDRLRDRLQQDVLSESLAVETTGLAIGEVNGLAVAELGGFRFGHPLRVTATARLGDDKVLDIERESSLGQPLHSKGVLILSSFLGARYGGRLPLSFAASLVFEQSYGPVEGDSASLAELCALLSALGRVPLRRHLAVTGSVNQYGAVQAVGAVNEKVEGFFDLCRARGLTGEQGVLVPATNVQHLMLRESVVDAVAQGRFHIYAVSDVDEALALLSGRAAGTADASGHWPTGSFNRAVADRLEELALLRQTYGIGQRPRARRPRHAPAAGAASRGSTRD